MICRKCSAKAAIKIERHHTAFCKACFDEYFLNQIRKAIEEERMFAPEERVLVAVSGGKDSLALWDALIRLGYRTAGLHVDQGIGEYSKESRRKTESHASQRGLELIVHDLKKEYGGGIPQIAEKTDRPSCSACGTIKRHAFNDFALRYGFPVVATGHNLDDEAARLLGNVLHWQEEYLEKQSPTLPAAHGRLARKVKPLFRLAEREIAAYAVLNRIDYIVEECPMAKGSKMLLYKEILNRLEEESPGTKQNFYLSFLKRRKADGEPSDPPLNDCLVCGRPTTGSVCGHCRLIERLGKVGAERSSSASNS